MSNVQFSLLGFDEIVNRMNDLSQGLRGKAARSALGSATRVITNAAKANALRVDNPDTGRRIADNITQRFRSRYYRQTGDLMISVGVSTPKGRIPKGNPDEGVGGPTYHWHLVEEGTEKMRAQPYLRPAMESSANEVLDVFATKLDAQVAKLLVKSGGH